MPSTQGRDFLEIVMKVKTSLCLWVLGFSVSSPFTSADAVHGSPDLIAYDHPNIWHSGAVMTKDSDLGREFLRFTEDLYTDNGGSFDGKRARTTSGVNLQFKTGAKEINLYFRTKPEDENRGSQFAIYANGRFLPEYAFPKESTGKMMIPIKSGGGESIRYEVVLPSWANPHFAGLTLSDGKLEEMPERQQPVFVALGDSISHGTGQGSASYLTWPWILSRNLDLELYNLAVGGAKISVPVADMLDEFSRIDLVTILIGYNDWNAGVSVAEVAKQRSDDRALACSGRHLGAGVAAAG